MGGTQTYLLRLVSAMRRVAPDREFVVFLNEEAAAFRAPELEGLEIDVCPLSGRARPLRLLWEHTRLPVRAAVRSIDLLHSLGYMGPSRLAMPSVVTVLDLVHYHFPAQVGPAKSLLWRWLFPRSLNAASHIVTISESVAREVEARFPRTRGKVTAVPLAADPVCASPRQPASATDGAPFLLAVASPAPHKNLVVALRALAILATKFPTLRLKLAGMRTATTEHLAATARELGIADRVEFTGRVSDQELDALYRGACAMVFPSLYEGFGLPPLEAMARGCPVIASDRSAIPEVVGDSAILFDPERPEALAAAIRRVLADPSVGMRLRAAGPARARRFDWETTASNTLAVYDRVLAAS
jgi:glycosyltransferase involved in cell wall biosynthesis